MKSNKTVTEESRFLDGRSAALYSMSGLDYSNDFRSLVFALKSLPQSNLVLDGEIVALDREGRASFRALQNRRTAGQSIVYYIFDVLHRDGEDLLAKPFHERRALLEELLAGVRDPLRINPVFRIDLAPLVGQVRRLSLEGIVAKRASLCCAAKVGG